MPRIQKLELALASRISKNYAASDWRSALKRAAERAFRARSPDVAAKLQQTSSSHGLNARFAGPWLRIYNKFKILKSTNCFQVRMFDSKLNWMITFRQILPQTHDLCHPFFFVQPFSWANGSIAPTTSPLSTLAKKIFFQKKNNWSKCKISES